MALQVPELWIYDRGLKVYIFKSEDYREVENSPTFPGVSIKAMVERVIHQAQQVGSSRALRALEEML